MEFEVVPHKGIGNIELGMSREKVRALMPKAPDTFRKSSSEKFDTDAFFNSCFQVFYNGEDPKVEYIELSANTDFKTLFNGVDIFSLEAEEAVRLVSQISSCVNTDEFSYEFPELDLSLWRPFLPEDPGDEDGKYFSTIGVGVNGYYS
ncbi:MAG: hypothetical protein ABFS32_22995 [Bacteroidota bacterium]